MDQQLVFGVWIGVSKDNFYRYQGYLANEKAEPDPPPIYGALCGVIPDYSSEEVLWSEIRIHIRRGGLIPSVEIHDSSHPLYSLQQEGATLEYWHQVVGSLMPELAARYGIGSS